MRTLGLHPSGDWLVVGTQHPTIRFYDLATSACYTSPMQSDHHRGPITDISFSQDAKIFATSRFEKNILIFFKQNNLARTAVLNCGMASRIAAFQLLIALMMAMRFVLLSNYRKITYFSKVLFN